jgi:thiol-disulfide isomerase/thioredoxin
MNLRNIIATSGITAFALACGGTTGGGTPQTGKRVEDLQFLAFVDEGDGMPASHEPRMIRLSDYFAQNRPGTKVIMLNAAAGWCGPCMHEASAMADFASIFQPRGVAILTAVFQKADGEPADRAFTQSWAQSFHLPIPTIIDTSFAMGKYFDVSTMPANMFINAQTGEILKIKAGAEPGSDPMKAYRELLQYYLQKL